MRSWSGKKFELLVVPGFSCTLFLWPGDCSAWLWAAGRCLALQVFPMSFPAANHQTATEYGSLEVPPNENQSFCPKSNPDGYISRDYSCWFVHKKHRWRTPAPSPSIILSGLFSILLMFVKHLKRQGFNNSQQEPISPCEIGYSSLFSTRTLAILGM